VFGTLSSFDDHQVRNEFSVVTACTPPEALGFVRDAHGTWQTAAGLAARERTRQMMAVVHAQRRDAGVQRA
jgi:hypothetical protein